MSQSPKERHSSTFEIEEEILTKNNLQELLDDGLSFTIAIKQQKNRFIQENQYILWAVASALCYSIHNYSIAYAQHIWEEQNTFIILPEGFSWILTFIVYHVVAGIQTKKIHGKFWQRKQSVLFIKNTRQLDQGVLILLFIRTIVATTGTICLAGIMYFAKEAGISPSALFSVTSFSSFTTAVGFYYIYGERLTIKHVLGMLLIMVGIVILPLSKAFEKNDLDVETSLSSQKELIIAIGLSLIFCLGMLVNGVTLRYAVRKGYDPFQFTIDFHALAGILYIIGFSVSQGIWQTFTLLQVAFLQIPGLVVIFSTFFQNKAFLYGKGGLVSAITQLSRIFQMIFEILIQKRIPNTYELLALAFGVLGSVVITTSRQ